MKNLIKILLPLYITLTISFTAKANDCEAESMIGQYYEQAKDQLSEQKCINIKISEIYEPEDHHMVYRWNMGDGKKKTGLDISHCYEKYGHYKATLDAKLPATEFISKNEMNLDIVIKEPVKINLFAESQWSIDQNATFSYTLSPLITYEIAQVYWQVGEEAFYCGKKELTHKFSTPGKYNLKILIQLKNMDGYYYLADHKEIEVTGNNIFGRELKNFFYKEHTPNPFLEDSINIAIIAHHTQMSWEYTIHQNDSLCIMLPNTQQYNLYLWQGNRFIEPISFSTKECNDSLATFLTVRKILREALENDLQVIMPISFEFNSTSLDGSAKKQLKRNVKLLQQLPGFTCIIGSFTHTGGALQINLEYSDARTQLVKQYLQKKLDQKTNLLMADARKETCLINTSFSENGEQTENEQLNGKTFIKIEGIEKAN